jgi:hypothetical protein
MQISGAASNGWLALGQGTQMSDANYFIVYLSSSGSNITLSTRSGNQHGMPLYDSSIQASLLPSSNISSSGVITANIKCSNCNAWNGGSMDFSSLSTNWIWAYGPGDPLNSDNVSVAISRHSLSDGFGIAQFGNDVKGGNDTDPWTTITSQGQPSGCGATNESGACSVNSSSSTTGAAEATGVAEASGAAGENRAPKGNAALAHGVLAAVAFVFVFPIGGIMIRLMSFKKLWMAHGILQTVGFLGFIIGAGIGIRLAFQMKVNIRFLLYTIDD